MMIATAISEDRPSCPFCRFTVPSSSEMDMYGLMHHLEVVHPEGDTPSPFVVRDTTNSSPGRKLRPNLDNGLSHGSSSSEATSHSHSRSPSSDENASEWYVECPANCGEAIHIRELEEHMELHEMEKSPLEDRTSPGNLGDLSPGRSASRSPRPDPGTRHNSSTSLSVPSANSPKHNSKSASVRKQSSLSPFGSLRGLLMGPAPRKTRTAKRKKSKSGIRRLGKSELGPYAFEEQMPSWLRRQLEQGAKVSIRNEIAPNGQIIPVKKVANETEGVIPVLAQLCEQDPAISKVFLCHPSVKHIFKMSQEGGFCGYRNIQMAVSFLQGTQFPGALHFPGETPNILTLQELIEAGWDKGFNSTGRIETGGIKGTRKYIGTPEAQGLFLSLNISCEATAFNTSELSDDKTYVHDAVVQALLEYFRSGVVDPHQKVYQTGLAPVYFQHPGHSLTVVGLEVRKTGALNLLVFDPMFKTPPGVVKMIGSQFVSKEPGRLLKAFRRGDSYLSKYDSFEILKLTNPHFSEQLYYEQDLVTASHLVPPIRGDGNLGDVV